jgi:hypothetical protein
VVRSVRVESGSTPWLVQRSSPSSRRLTLLFKTVHGRDIDARVERVEVTETADVVRIAVIQTIRTRAGAVNWVTGSDWSTLTLGEPLGDRALVHRIEPSFSDLVPVAAPPDHRV